MRDHRGEARLGGFASMLQEADLLDDLVLRFGLPSTGHELCMDMGFELIFCETTRARGGGCNEALSMREVL